MHQAMKRILVRRLHALPMKSHKQRSRTSPIKTLIVIKNPAFQVATSRLHSDISLTRSLKHNAPAKKIIHVKNGVILSGAQSAQSKDPHFHHWGATKTTTTESPDTEHSPNPAPSPASAAHHRRSARDPAAQSTSSAPPAAPLPQSSAAANRPLPPDRPHS